MIGKIKEFLKPNLGKVILTVGFGLAAYYWGINWCGGLLNSPLSVCHVLYNPIYWGPVAYLNISITDFTVAHIAIEQWISGIIFWYLIASMIMYAYSMLKKKNETIR